MDSLLKETLALIDRQKLADAIAPIVAQKIVDRIVNDLDSGEVGEQITEFVNRVLFEDDNQLMTQISKAVVIGLGKKLADEKDS